MREIKKKPKEKQTIKKDQIELFKAIFRLRNFTTLYWMSFWQGTLKAILRYLKYIYSSRVIIWKI